MTSRDDYVSMWHIMEALQTRYLLTQEMIAAILKVDAAYESKIGSKDIYDEVEDLLEKGADADGMPGASMLRPLHAASKIGRPDVIKILLGRGANMNSKDAVNSRSPLHYASEVNAESVEILLKSGAIPDITDEDGNTPLHWAVYKNQTACARCLLLHSASVNIQNLNGDAPLGFATMKGNAECVSLLLDFGADATMKNYSGKSALIRAATMQYSELSSYSDEICFNLLLRASGRLSLKGNDQYESNISNSEKEIHQFLVSIAAKVPTLASLCRASIRQQLVNRFIPDAVDSFRLPNDLKKFLLLKD